MRSRTGGALLGHKISHDAAHLYRSVVEGWALAAEHALSSLGSGDRLRDVVCIGGGSMSSLRARVKASILSREIRCLTTPEIVAVGAQPPGWSGIRPRASWLQCLTGCPLIAR
jgi:sugar (pentulose or hexulose) kinase